MKGSKQVAGCKRWVESTVGDSERVHSHQQALEDQPKRCRSQSAVAPPQSRFNFFEIARQRLKAEREGLPPWHTQLTPAPQASTPKKTGLPQQNVSPKAVGSTSSHLG